MMSAMQDLSSAWITGLLMATMAGTVGYLIFTRDWLPWRAFVRDMGLALSGQPVDGGPIRFEHDGRPCQVTLSRARQGPAQFWLAVQADVASTLSLHKKGTGDAIAASAGLRVPLVTGYPDVDRQWLIGCADADRARSLLADAGLRSTLGALLRAGVHTVVWSAEDRAVSVRGASRLDVQQDGAVLKLALGLAVQSSKPWPQPDSAPWPPGTRVEARSQGIHIGTLVIVALVLPALATLPVIGLDMAYPPLDRSAPMGAAAAFALAATAGLYGWVRRLARRRVLEHRPALFLLPIGAVGFWVLGYGAIVGLNGAADTAIPAEVEARIQAPIPPAYGIPPEHRLPTSQGVYVVSASLHEQARPGDRLHVVTRPGRLGIAWRDPMYDLRLVPER